MEIEASSPPSSAPAPARVSVPRNAGIGGRPPSNTDFVRDMHNADDRSVRDWIDSLAGDDEIKVTITRKKPTLGSRGENIAGVLETVEDKIDEDYIREQWGGGDFQLKVQTLRPDGTFKYFRARTVKLAGPAKMQGKVVQAVDEASPAVSVAASDESPLAERAFGAMERAAREAQERADRAELAARAPAPGLDFTALQVLQAPLVAQIASANATIADLQRQVIELVGRPAPRDDFRDRIMEQAVTGEGQRVETLRATYDARLEKLRDNFEDEKKRIEDRHQAEIRRLEAQHERELKMLEKQSDSSAKNADVAHSSRLEAQKETINRLERELTAAAAKIAALEAKKDKTIGEQAAELMKVKESLDELGGGGGDDDKDAPWYRQIIDGIGNSEAAMTWIGKLTGGAPAQQPPQLPPPGVPYQTEPGGPIYIRDAQGQVRIVDQAMAERMAARQRKRARRQASARAAGAEPGAASETAAAPAGEPSDADLEAALTDPAPQQVTVKKPAKKDVDRAIEFAEAALRAGDSDEKVIGFASAARNLMPGDILAYIQQVGPDAFITEAKLPVGSPLATVRGRTFLKKVFKVLVEGQL